LFCFYFLPFASCAPFLLLCGDRFAWLILISFPSAATTLPRICQFIFMRMDGEAAYKGKFADQAIL
jgi:hypothetical protein